MAGEGARGHEVGPSVGGATGGVRERAASVGQWLLIGADRNLLTLLLGVAIFLSLVAVGSVWSFEMRDLVTETRAVQTLFNTLLSGIILLVSIVVSINSVVLTQEVTSLGTQQDRVENTLEFRRDLENAAGEAVSPVGPREFLDFILLAIREDATSLRGLVRENPDAEVREEVLAYLDDVVADVDRMRDRLSDVDEQPRDVLFAGLHYDYSWQLYAARRFRRVHADALTDAERDRFDELVDAFRFFATAREYLKTLYIEQELGTLSKTLLYVSLPAIVFTSYVLLAIDAGLFPVFTIPGIPRLLLFVSVAFVVALAPFLLLTAYIIRVATVSERSLAAGPLNLGGGQGRDTFEDRHTIDGEGARDGPGPGG